MPVLANKRINRPGAFWDPKTEKWLTDLVPIGQCVRISARYGKRWLKKRHVNAVYFDLPYHWCCGGITIGVEGGSEMKIMGRLYTDGGVITWTKRGGSLYTGASITIPKAASYWNYQKMAYRVRAAHVFFLSLRPDDDIGITGAFASGAGGATTGERKIDFTT